MGYLNPQISSRSTELQGVFAGKWLAAARTEASSDELGDELAALNLRAEEALCRFQQLTDGYFVVLKEQASSGRWDGIDGEITFLLRLEREEIPQELKNFKFSWRRKKSGLGVDGRNFPDFLDKVAESVHRNSITLMAVCRDARWRLMSFRAENQPSVPASPIQGEATDLDAYLRSLG